LATINNLYKINPKEAEADNTVHAKCLNY